MERTKLTEYAGHYYYQTLPDLLDLLAVVVSFLATTGALLMMVSALFLLFRKPRQRFWATVSVVVLLSGGYYFLSYLFDVRSVVAIATNPGGDVPLASSLKTLSIAVLMFSAALVMHRATRSGGTR